MTIAASIPSARDEATSDRKADPGRTGPGLWLWPSLVALALTTYGLAEPLLGRDELVTWDVVNRTTGQILATARNVDAVHTAYYLLMHFWVSLSGDSVTALRVPSVLAAAGTAAVVALIGNRMFGRRAGITGGMLFALLPAASRYGQEARSYALVVFLVALATLLLLRALEEPRKPLRWVGYALTMAGVGLLHLIALCAVLGHACAVAAVRRRDRSLPWTYAAVLVAVGACTAPLAVLGRSHAHRQLYWVPAPDLWALFALQRDVFASVFCAGAVTALALVAALSVPAGRERTASVVPCAVLAVLPPVVVWLGSHGEVSYVRHQYVLFTLPFWAVLAGAGLAAVARSRKAVAAVLAVLAVLTWVDQRQMRGRFEHDVPVPLDYAAAARLITRQYQPGDAVVYDRDNTWQLDGGVTYYLPPDVRMRDVFRARRPVEINDLYVVPCTPSVSCLGPEERVWLVTQGVGDPDPLNALSPDQASALRLRYAADRGESVTGITVTLLVRRGTGA
ncbi:glycosyltransferase family 39 protein [Streptomyces sp. NPDC101132]|uniref:glycosyltransferase family 39 protein n=1 Tax=Streptomyces sp. NPDC101132 TaxID=3366110 RepID=UPI0038132907